MLICKQCFHGLRSTTSKPHRSLYSARGINLKTCLLPPSKTWVASLRRAATVANPVEISAQAQKIVGTWLVGCAGMCFGAVILGGVTRLTESGLSMVDWRLIKDMKPPGSEKEWIEEFERYKQFPEYQQMSNQKEMTLSDFKFIFYMEWGHRMWGRTTGMVFLLPAFYFLRKGWVSKALKPRLAIFAGLLGFQGFLGWYMVKSGLEEKPGPNDVARVSQYRLAAHLGSAFLLYTLFLWQGLSHLLTPIQMPDVKSISKLRGLAHGVMTAVFVTALSVVLIGGFWWMARKAPLHPRARLAVNLLLGMAFGQATLGVTTLLTYVPTPVAAIHQSGSLVLLSFALWVAHELRRLPKV
ncbi:cytochrome c oxidase assembly protein COX15-like protein [Elysia marginata]|uniref:Cytochrome c oxidase assembly protein COX15-like protein n=1 Tax=Elysia marginata TaxID=1093978 RepID=A0AAV4GQA6_9GAST|nr:cytochrome c oxidase assembly protein COX15-like protein [Elysia marginata]